MTESDCPGAARAHALRRFTSGRRWSLGLIGLAHVLLLLIAFVPNVVSVPNVSASGANTNAAMASHGPTLHLTADRLNWPGDPVADFMYFVALISPEPVSILQSPGNTQRARLLKASRRVNGNKFLVSCEFEFAGQGFQRNVFDHSDKIRQNAAKLRNGGLLDHQLGSINVEGSGVVAIDVEGKTAGSESTVTEMRLRFGGHGRPSPVTIDLHDLRYVGGSLRKLNEIVARVDTLTFRRQPGSPKMDLSVASIHKKDATDSSWESLLGKVKATAANLVLEPVDVDGTGNEAMLRFGLALAQQSPDFTFPVARNLR